MYTLGSGARLQFSVLVDFSSIARLYVCTRLALIESRGSSDLQHGVSSNSHIDLELRISGLVARSLCLRFLSRDVFCPGAPAVNMEDHWPGADVIFYFCDVFVVGQFAEFHVMSTVFAGGTAEVQDHRRLSQVTIQ